jgi:hypothetical protein
MAVHLATGTEWFPFKARVCIYLCKELGSIGEADGKHKGLVTVIPATEISRIKEFSHGHLGHFLTISKNAKFSFAGQNLFASQKTGEPAYAGNPVVVQNRVPEGIKG